MTFLGGLFAGWLLFGGCSHRKKLTKKEARELAKIFDGTSTSKSTSVSLSISTR